MDLEYYKSTLIDALKAGGTILSSYFNGHFTIEEKEGNNNLVTEADRKSEIAIISVIQNALPHHQILGEEYGEQVNDSDYLWVVDPIDGTVNFAHGVPLCCVSIALVHLNQVILGGVYNPLMNELFLAEKDGGATLNGKSISVSQKNDFNKSFLVTGFSYHLGHSRIHPLKLFNKFINRGLPVRRLGSAALDLCWVACGRFDAFWEQNLNPWDIAAGYLIVEEAGGKITNFSGEPYSIYDKETVATNGILHNHLLNEIQEEF